MLLEEVKINVQVIKSKRKSLKMTVKADATVLVEAPEALAEEKIKEIILSKKTWIIEKVEQRLSLGPCYNQMQGVENEKLLYLGRQVLLKIQDGQSNKEQVMIRNGQLLLNLPNATPENCVATIKKWYYQKTKKEVNFWIHYYQHKFDKCPNRIVIKEQKRRWASCSSADNLNFNWRLAMLPTWVISYVVLHEMCHFEEMNHSAAFWSLVESHMPEYKRAKDWLKENGHRFLPE